MKQLVFLCFLGMSAVLLGALAGCGGAPESPAMEPVEPVVPVKPVEGNMGTPLQQATSVMEGDGGMALPEEGARLQTLLAQWRKLPEAGAHQMNIPAAIQIMTELQGYGYEKGVKPIVAALGAPESTPAARVLATICLTPILSEEMLPQLIAFSKPGQDTTARACAARLLGSMALPEAQEQVHALMDDAEPRVKVAAMLILVRGKDPEVLKRIDELWTLTESDIRARQELLMALPMEQSASFLAYYAKALNNVLMDSSIRMHCATLMGRVGGAEVLPALDQCAAQDSDPAVREVAKNAAAAVRARTESAATAENAGAEPEEGKESVVAPAL